MAHFVSLIVLLILAAVSLSAVFNEKGIFSRAEQAKDKYGQAKARETLELVLSEFQITKYEEGLSGENYENRLDSKIAEVGSLIPKEDENSKYKLVIVDGHIFEIDRSVPKIVDYKGPADGIIITAKITQNGDWQNPVATVTGTITKYGGGSVVSSTATATEGVTITGFPTTGGNYTIPNITKDTDITITASADDGKPAVTKTIKVRLVRDNTPPTITLFEANADGLVITIKAKAEDTESGMENLTYTITSIQDTALEGILTEKRTGTLEQGKAVTIETTPTGNRKETTYKVTLTAKDFAGNSTTAEKELKTEDVVYKHIKTPEGLKAVKARDIYGATVTGYTCSRTEVEWQIFYIDDEDDHRVYLISKDYVDPPTTGTELTPGNSKYSKAYTFNDTVLNKFNTTIPDTPFTQKFLSNYAGKEAGAWNLRSTNYMLDQSVWNEYVGPYAVGAYGGPTLPLYIASYNDVTDLRRLDGRRRRIAWIRG